MSKQAEPLDLAARIEVLRARAEHHNAEARAAEVELAQLEVEIGGCNPDAIDDGEMPVSEWLDYAACAEADPFERQTCRGCTHEMEPSERGRGFCRCCREEDDERFRVSAPIPNDNIEER